MTLQKRSVRKVSEKVSEKFSSWHSMGDDTSQVESSTSRRVTIQEKVRSLRQELADKSSELTETQQKLSEAASRAEDAEKARMIALENLSRLEDTHADIKLERETLEQKCQELEEKVVEMKNEVKVAQLKIPEFKAALAKAQNMQHVAFRQQTDLELKIAALSEHIVQLEVSARAQRRWRQVREAARGGRKQLRMNLSENPALVEALQSLKQMELEFEVANKDKEDAVRNALQLTEQLQTANEELDIIRMPEKGKGGTSKQKIILERLDKAAEQVRVAHAEKDDAIQKAKLVEETLISQNHELRSSLKQSNEQLRDANVERKDLQRFARSIEEKVASEKEGLRTALKAAEQREMESRNEITNLKMHIENEAQRRQSMVEDACQTNLRGPEVQAQCDENIHLNGILDDLRMQLRTCLTEMTAKGRRQDMDKIVTKHGLDELLNCGPFFQRLHDDAAARTTRLETLRTQHKERMRMDRECMYCRWCIPVDFEPEGSACATVTDGVHSHKLPKVSSVSSPEPPSPKSPLSPGSGRPGRKLKEIKSDELKDYYSASVSGLPNQVVVRPGRLIQESKGEKAKENGSASMHDLPDESMPRRASR